MCVGPRVVRRHRAGSVRRRSALLAAQVAVPGLPVVPQSRSAERQSAEIAVGRRGRHICGREGNAAEEG
jgi:hypothetical protein